MSLTAVQHLMTRTIGNRADSFNLEWMRPEPENGKDRFECLSKDGKILIRGTSESALTSGFHWYLKHVCHVNISWCGTRLELPAEFPEIRGHILHESPYMHRYNLNYCTYSYSMPFWSWERWEQELDWMALNGINLMLTLTGQEEVWRRTLLRLGYSEDEVSGYLCGPAFFAWQWMQNLTSWGGPLPSWWFEEQTELAKKIRRRMNDLGIKPVVQGFSGMVPKDFKDKHPEANPVDQGQWCKFDRPLLLLPEDPAYRTAASIYYEELRCLYGEDVHHYSIDPFHEGGNSGDVDLAEYAGQVLKSLLQHDDEAVWVLQAWEGNPKPELLGALPRNRALILDLWCESKPAWKDSGAFQGLSWVWNMIQNYGGKNGLFGNLKKIAHDPLAALKDQDSGQMTGIGLSMEGIGTNPVMYDLLTDMMWREEEPDLESWLEGYLLRRYGAAPESARKAWRLLSQSSYGIDSVQQGAVESMLCARPALDIRNVSTWGPRNLEYDPKLVRNAAKELFNAFNPCGSSDGYLYDVVDITRQAMADLSRKIYEEAIQAYREGQIEEFDRQTEQFLKLLAAQDKLLSTRNEFMLGPWLAAARAKGRTEEDKNLFEFNARSLITLWGPEASAETLRDYSHREWSGLLDGFYGPRWKLYFKVLRESLQNGAAPQEPDWYSWEYSWTCERDSGFSEEPQGSVREELEFVISTFL